MKFAPTRADLNLLDIMPSGGLPSGHAGYLKGESEAFFLPWMVMMTMKGRPMSHVPGIQSHPSDQSYYPKELGLGV